MTNKETKTTEKSIVHSVQNQNEETSKNQPEVMNQIQETLKEMGLEKWIIILSLLALLKDRLMIATGHPLITHFAQAGSVGLIFIGEHSLMERLKAIPVVGWQLQFLEVFFILLLYEYIKYLYLKGGSE